MRGVAVLAAMTAVWVIVVGALPIPRLERPSVDPRTVGFATGTLVVGFSIAYALLDAPVPAFAFAVLLSLVPFHSAAVRKRRAREAAAAAWPDLLAHIRSSVAAGRTLPDSYVDAARRVGAPFEGSVEEVRRELLYGGGFKSAMALVRDQANDPTADRVTMTLVAADQSGGSRVGELLASLSASVAAESRLRQAHEAALTEQRWTASVALAAPWVILALSIATNPQASDAYATAEGGVVILVGMTMTVAGWVLARRTAALSELPRLFR